jgi:hypothetical protein
MSDNTYNMNISIPFGVATQLHRPFIVNMNRPRIDYKDASEFWTKNQTIDYRMNSQHMREPIVVVEWTGFKADSRIGAFMNR